MFRAPKAKSEGKPGATEERQASATGPVSVIKPAEFALGLTPAELAALISKLCLCRTVRVRSAGQRLEHRRRCAVPPARQWCRAGRHAVAGNHWVDSKFL
jgi:hypothetical protein